MAARSESRLYLFVPLPDDVGEHLAVSNDVEPMLPGLRLVSAARRHITLASLHAADVPQDHIIQLARWVMATMPPFAFHVVFDQLVSGARSTLLKASQPLVGALEAQAHFLDMMRHYGLDLPREAGPVPHVTLGYGYPEARGVRPIDGISWLADELVLVRSWPGRTWHEELGRWRLPARAREAAA
jgi:RNA 2',3'-cyclic 3'-phosphodiesterase